MKTFYTLVILAITLTSKGYSTTIISSTVLNGSFETGSISPWGGGSAIYDPTNSPQGEWYAQTIATVNRASFYINMSPVSTSDKDFVLSFSAMALNGEFKILSSSLNGRTKDNGFVYADVISSSGTITDEWSSHSYTFRFPDTWDTTKGIGLGFLFQSGAQGSAGFIDDVSLAQIPEPSSIAVFASGLALLSVFTRRRIAEQAAPDRPLPAAQF